MPLVESHTFAEGLQEGKVRIIEDRLVTTIRAMMIYIALLHTRLVVKIRSRKRQIDNLVDVREDM